jgi:hypothetical protein
MIYPPFHTRKQNDGSDNEVPYFQENFQNHIHIDIFIWPISIHIDIFRWLHMVSNFGIFEHNVTDCALKHH